MGSFEALSRDECLRLLARSATGRLGVVVGHYPLIFPVTYALDGDLVTIRSGPGTKFTASQYANVSFQVDQTEPSGHAAWSVLVLGAASIPDISDPAEVQRLEQLGIRPVAPGDKPLWIQVVPEHITGRRVVADESGGAFDPRGYLGLYY
ncbi:pyridoxamine 5'-phosphate oxidase family protein [Pseudonocardia bannensis]|uniref:Pyridoxamine 5'-phosphate oxidase family protein n=1 Tax=Pseudonocardia bannensis TaxID=630973 RepID=A0A848DF49_9PSEU|nr:pyridoxamine 5'-phosphate oxidase family protein [Pseudonocardia bannensis]NMH91237.1 pyridoxamine 5'-phosphate oxidase family protein [Pseudonocardia bannensis]